MRINLNGEKTECPFETSLQHLINHHYPNSKRLAVVVNESLILPMQWEKYRLTEGDSVQVIVPAQGG